MHAFPFKCSTREYGRTNSDLHRAFALGGEGQQERRLKRIEQRSLQTSVQKSTDNWLHYINIPRTFVHDCSFKAKQKICIKICYTSKIIYWEKHYFFI